MVTCAPSELEYWTTLQRFASFARSKTGKQIDIDDNFSDSGDTISGSDDDVMTANYGDIGEPPPEAIEI